MSDPRFCTNADRVAHRSDLRHALIAVLEDAPAEHWHDLLTRAGIPCGPINDIAQGLDMARALGLAPQVTAVDSTDPAAHVTAPFHVSRNSVTYRRRPPQLGADTDSVVERFELDG